MHPFASEPFIAVTDKAWFDYLSSRSQAGRLDEVNFWSPKSVEPMKAMPPGTPVFFKLKRPDDAIAGYGFFAHFAVLDLELAWNMFAEKNGAPGRFQFFARIGGYREVELLRPETPKNPLGCTILRDAVFWPRVRWLAWGAAQGWHRNIVQGKTESDALRASRLLGEIAHDHLRVPEDLAEEFLPLDFDERELVQTEARLREGQGTFRARLLAAYGGRCAITGERTEPVLDAAHVQPYLGPRSNHIQNGLLLIKEFHALFDEGLVTVTPEYIVRVSPRIRRQWKNGRRFYEFDGRSLVQLPSASSERPCAAALKWHNERFVA
jgi:putative restriction endonuclease